MKLPPILSIIWARRAVFAVPVAGALIGSAVTMAILPPKYQASARVVLNYIKPEPETGIFIGSKMAESYERSQIDFVRSGEVAGIAAETMGWLDTPEMQEAYALRDPRDTRDMASWVASRLVGNINAVMVEDSNILEIRYLAPTPEIATAVVSALRDAYLQASTNQLRQSADEKANANAERLAKTNAHIAQLEAEKTRLERATGLILDPHNRELDATRLGRYTGSGRPPKPAVALPSRREAAAMNQLAAVETAIAAGDLGPSNPRYQALVRQRDQMRAAANDLAGRNNAISAFFQQQERAQAAMFESLKAKVLAQRSDALQLQLIQDQIDRERQIALELSQNTAEQRQLSGGEQTGLVAIGEPSEGRRSVRSNEPLIISTAVAAGALYGILLALLVEFLARKVRTPEALRAAARAPVIGVIPRGQHRPQRQRKVRRGKGFVWRGRPAPAQA